VPYVLVAPQHRGALGELAGEIFRARYRGLKGLRSPTLGLLSQLLGGESPAHGELLSYLFFDPEFVQELIEMGRRDAQRALAEGPDLDNPWQVGPHPALTGDSRRDRNVMRTDGSLSPRTAGDTVELQADPPPG
jgi:NTE family protein